MAARAADRARREPAARGGSRRHVATSARARIVELVGEALGDRETVGAGPIDEHGAVLIRTPAGQALLWIRPADEDAPALVQTLVPLADGEPSLDDDTAASVAAWLERARHCWAPLDD